MLEPENYKKILDKWNTFYYLAIEILFDMAVLGFGIIFIFGCIIIPFAIWIFKNL